MSERSELADLREARSETFNLTDPFEREEEVVPRVGGWKDGDYVEWGKGHLCKIVEVKGELVAVDEEDVDVFESRRWLKNGTVKKGRIKWSVSWGGGVGWVVRKMVKGKFVFAHRVIWEKCFGEIPKGKVLVARNGNYLDLRKANYRMKNRGRVPLGERANGAAPLPVLDEWAQRDLVSDPRPVKIEKIF